MDNYVDIQIADIGMLPHTISEVAAWHHSEWIKGLPEKVFKEQAQLGTLGRELHERVHSLREHLEPSAVPSTFIAHKDGRPVGSVSVVNYQFSREHKPSQWLTNLFVVDAYRQRGLGTRLIDSAVSHAFEHGISKMYLYTRDLDQYYIKRGWQFSHEGVVQGSQVSVLTRNTSG